MTLATLLFNFIHTLVGSLRDVQELPPLHLARLYSGVAP
jgi:hypothetical protein